MKHFVDGALVEVLRVVYNHPEILLWERYWVERNKDMTANCTALSSGVTPNCNLV